MIFYRNDHDRKTRKYDLAEKRYSENKKSPNERAVIHNKEKIIEILNYTKKDQETLRALTITDDEMDILYRMGLGVLPPSVFSFFIPSLSGGGLLISLP
ncbi:hypothetical protein ID0090_03770 [Helicobacter pylori]